MDDIWVETFHTWAQTDEYKRYVRAAHRRIMRALEKHRMYLAYSGGKDSSVMLHLVLQHDPETMVHHWDYGRYFVPREVHQEIIVNARKTGAQNLEIDTSKRYDIEGRDAYNIWGDEHFNRVVPELIERGFTGGFIGIRAEESRNRRDRIRRQEYLSELYECWPLQDWRWQDVWAYIVTEEVPYLSIYDDMNELVGYDQARWVTMFDHQFRHLGADTVDNVLHWRWRNEHTDAD